MSDETKQMLQEANQVAKEIEKETAEKKQKSQEKLTSALTLVVQELAQSGLDKIIAKTGITEGFIQDLTKEIEKTILQKKTNPETAPKFNTAAFVTASAGEKPVMKKQTPGRLQKLLTATKGKVDKAHTDIIAKVVGDLYA
jgi:dynactin complex subunit